MRRVNWEAVPIPQRAWLVADWARLPDAHYQESYRNEEQLVSCMIVDESIRREASCKQEHFSDERLGVLFQRMWDYPDIDLENLLADRCKGESLRLLGMMFTRRGREKMFEWNFEWFCHQVRVLGEKRIAFSQSLECVLDSMST